MLNDASSFTHIYLCTGYTNLRKGIDGLVAIVKGEPGLDPAETGCMFLFCGRRNDRMKALHQLSFDMKTGEILNEAEKLVEHGIPAETDYEEVIVKRKKVKGKRDINLENLDVEIINHEYSKEDLENEFPNGWNCLPDYIYKELKYIPAKFKVLEHHVKVYAGKREGDG